MPPKVGVRIVLLGLLCALGCGSDDKVLEGEDLPNVDGGSGGADAGSNGSSDANAGGNDGGANGDFEGGTPSDPTCDMNGIWIGRQITVSQSSGSQFANNWYYLELRQDGDEVVVSKHFDCGIEVQSFVALVELKPNTTKALMQRNVQTGRKGTLKKGSGETCDFTMERFWSVRGANGVKYTPNPRNSSESIEQVAAKNPLPTRSNTAGAEDWDGDGKLGVAWEVSKLALGTRNTVQRDWTRYFSDATHPFPAGTNITQDIIVRADFSNEEQVLDPASGLLAAGSQPDGSAEHNLTLRFLGRNKSDQRAKNLIKADDFDTCLAIQAALPAKDRL